MIHDFRLEARGREAGRLRVDAGLYRFLVDLGISSRTAAVAGASAGLGFASAKALAQEGVRVAICSRDATRVAEAAQRIGNSCIGIVADVSTLEGGQDFVRQATAALGHIDILVANGGGPAAGNFATTPVDAYITGLQQSLLSVVGMCTEVVSEMQSRNWGRIVAITSVAVRQPIPNLILSNTARAGVTGFLKTLAREVAPSGITVNSVQPGIHATDRIRQLYGMTPDASTLGIPAGVVGDPADFGTVVAFLCGESARFVTGTNIQVDGGSYAGLL
jgi:3-oxoacyl-[acyl-carrier protein] reductase